MNVPDDFKNKAGIYCITNTVNNKVYIGKSLNIHARLKNHIYFLNTKCLKQENSHFIRAWYKYKPENFICSILEECSVDIIASRELHWMQHFMSTDPLKGYNKRMDSSTGMIIHPETRLKLSIVTGKRTKTKENRENTSIFFKTFWANNPDKKEKMAQSVKRTKQKKYMFLKMNEEGTVLQTYDTVEDIIKENPSYKWQNIYSVCNGYKKRIYGYKWSKKLKI